MNRQTQKKIRKDKVIAAAELVFSEKGIEWTKMTDIAAASGFGVASVYRYFKTKLDVAIEVGIVYWDYLYQYLNKIDTEGMNGFEQMTAMMDVYLDQEDRLNNFYKFLEQLDGFLSRIPERPDRMKDYEAAVMRIEKMFLKIINEGIEDGSIKADLPVRKVYVMFGHTLSALKQKHCNRGLVISTDSKEQMDEEMHFIIEIFLNYLKAK